MAGSWCSARGRVSGGLHVGLRPNLCVRYAALGRHAQAILDVQAPLPDVGLHQVEPDASVGAIELGDGVLDRSVRLAQEFGCLRVGQARRLA